MRATPGGVVLWRRDTLEGSDVDLLVRPGRDLAVVEALGSLGLAPWPERPGQATWRAPGEQVVLDVWSSWAWPGVYPPLDGLLERAAPGVAGLDVAAPEDRLLAYAIDAIAGRSLASLRPRVVAALSEPGARERLEALARAERMSGPARLVSELLPDDEVLPLGRAVRAGLGSRRGRMALLERVLGRRPARVPGRPQRRPGRLLALSGPDGSGKSTTGLALAVELQHRGRPAIVMWTRLGVENGKLERVAGLIRRALARAPGASSAVDPASPVADRPARPTNASTPGARRLSDVVVPVWALLVAMAYVRHCRRGQRVRRAGVDVVCDRWLADALVDLRLRYGRQPLAERLLRAAMPRPDMAALLEIPADVAACRKPEDQDTETLMQMLRLYEEAAERLGLTRIDANRPPATVRADLLRLAGD